MPNSVLLVMFRKLLFRGGGFPFSCSSVSSLRESYVRNKRAFSWARKSDERPLSWVLGGVDWVEACVGESAESLWEVVANVRRGMGRWMWSGGCAVFEASSAMFAPSRFSSVPSWVPQILIGELCANAVDYQYLCRRIGSASARLNSNGRE